jgi:hypothetical protein
LKASETLIRTFCMCVNSQKQAKCLHSNVTRISYAIYEKPSSHLLLDLKKIVHLVKVSLYGTEYVVKSLPQFFSE